MEENNRRTKVARQIQKDLSEIFRLKGMNSYGGAMITVSEARISPDLSVARIFLSIFPSTKTKEVMKTVESEVKYFRGELGKRMRHQIRIIPELIFVEDDSLDRLENIDKLLNK